MGFYCPQESFPTYHFSTDPNGHKVVKRACELLEIEVGDSNVDYDEWCNAVEWALLEREEDIGDFEQVLESFNSELDFHDVILDDDVFDGYAIFVVINDNGDRIAWDREWGTPRLMGAVLKEERRIRDWLYEVPEQYGFELTSHPTGGNEYESFRAMSFARKPRASGRR